MSDTTASKGPVSNHILGDISTDEKNVPKLFSPNFRKNYFTHGTSVDRIERSPVHRAVLEHAQAYRCSQSRLVFMLIIPMCVIYLLTLRDSLDDPRGMYWWVILAFAGTTLRLFYCEWLKHRITSSTAKQLIRNEHGLLITALIPSIFVGAGSWLIGNSGDEYAVLCVALSSVIYSVGHASSVSVYPFALHILLISNLGQTIAFHFGLGRGDVHPEIGALLCAQVFVLMSMSRKLYSFFRYSKKSEYESLIANAESQKTIELKDTFIRSASHDLSQPVVALNILASSLKYMDTVEERADVATSMQKVAVILTEEVRKLDVGVGVDTSERSSSINIHNLCEAVASTEGVKCENVEITVEDNNLNPYVSNEYWVIARCLCNAVNNAMRHSYTEKVLITIREVDPVDGLERIEVSVVDFGKGMTPEAIKSLWEEQSGEYKGKLGLVSIQKLAKVHDIDVNLISCPEGGTKFTMLLKKAKPPAPLPSVASILHGAKVLIVDDQMLVAESLQTLLHKIGCETIVFTDPLKALDYSEFHTIDFAFIDDNLRSDLDGMSLGKLISVPDHRIAIITGNAIKERREHIRSNFRLLRKPFDGDSLENIFA